MPFPCPFYASSDRKASASDNPKQLQLQLRSLYHILYRGLILSGSRIRRGSDFVYNLHHLCTFSSLCLELSRQIYTHVPWICHLLSKYILHYPQGTLILAFFWTIHTSHSSVGSIIRRTWVRWNWDEMTDGIFGWDLRPEDRSWAYGFGSFPRRFIE